MVSVTYPAEDLDNTMGALLIGGFASCLLLGVTTMQLYFYWGHFPRDSKWNKALVLSIWFIDTFSTAFQCDALYFYLIAHHDDPSSLLDGIWTLDATALLEAFIGGPVQIFFAVRIWKLSQGSRRGTFITFVIIILSVLHSGFSIAFSIKSLQHTQFSWWPDNILWVNIVGLSLAAIADVLIAASVSHLLWMQREGTIFVESRNLINQLILYSVESGTVTSIWATVIVVAYVTMSHNLIWLGMLFILPKLYANSLMAMLNSRLRTRRALRGSDSDRSNGFRCLTRHSQALKPPSLAQSRFSGNSPGAHTCIESVTVIDTPRKVGLFFAVD